MTCRVTRVLAAATVAASTAVLVASGPAGAQTLPIHDPQASGVIGLCDKDLRPVSQGSLAEAPFVWRAVGASAAPGAWAETGRTATLYAYQPRPSVPAAEWSGLQLTSSGHYTNPAHPMAQSTRADSSLADFVAEFPPEVHGLIELRLYLGGPDLPLYSASYDTTIIQVTGQTWKVVQGGTVSCTAGRSVSAETVFLPSSVVNPPPHSGSSGASSATGSAGVRASGSASARPGSTATGPTRGVTGSASPAATSSAPSASAGGTAISTAHSASSAGRSGLIWAGAGIVVLLLALAGAIVYRRRRPT